jgi:preprotein translocase subunit SecF
MNDPAVISPSAIGRLLNGQTAIDFYAKRRIGFIGGIAVVVITIVSLFAQGLNLGLDFEGGNAWDVPASETFGVDQADQVLQDNGIDTAGARIQRRSSESTDVITVQIEEVPPEQSSVITQAFAEAAGVEVSGVSVSFTSSTWGSEITEKAIRALIIFLIVVSLFITVRFEWRMAIAALVAMAHDVIAVVGVYSVFQFEVTPATVVAFLTILGYSLYDTIVVFDRVKENEGKLAGARTPYEDIVNISMNQVLMRSINTSLASILPVISLLVIGWGLLGAVALQEFALALLVGMISGVYSSIMVATPLLASLRSQPTNRVRRPRLAGDALRAAVVGAGASGRVSMSGRTAEASRPDPDDEPSDDVVAVGSGASVGSSAPASGGTLGPNADQLLRHPPRPRKKKRH